jgi:hypothetical protein
MEFEERAADPMAGGLMEGYQCGQLWGAALAAGAQAHHILGSGPQAEAIAVIATQRIVQAFLKRNKDTNCLELTGVDLKTAQSQALRTFMKMFVEGKAIGCFSMAASSAHIAFKEINTTLAEKPAEAPTAPVSCSALLAQKMGLSERQVVMAAGFAGGIGLGGGACGALGVAYWVLGMNNIARQAEGAGLQIPGKSELIDQFVEAADYEFECAKIVGRKFENLEDHAEYIRNGGCSKIIEALAAYRPIATQMNIA